ncbi:MAG: hypothetical protein ACRD1T_16425, partial [Acidimicrobiia bacterium]
MIERHVRFADRAVLTTFIGLLTLPLCLATPLDARLFIGLPRIYSGDEPHYLIILNSLISDGDFDLKNNYASVHAGSAQAGQLWAGSALAPHVQWAVNEHLVTWFMMYEIDESRWRRNASNHPVPTRRQDAPLSVSTISHLPDYPFHPVGVAFLLAPICFLARNTTFVEPLAVLGSTAAVIVAMLLFRSVLDELTPSVGRILFVTGMTFLGTPVWHYGRSLFTEPYLVLSAVGAYAVYLRNRSRLLSGCFIAVGMLMKPPIAVLLLPLMADS